MKNQVNRVTDEMIAAQVAKVPNMHIIEVKAIAATDKSGRRIRLTSQLFKQSVVIPFNYSYDSMTNGALDYLIRHGYTPIYKGEGAKDDQDFIIVSDKYDNGFRMFTEAVYEFSFIGGKTGSQGTLSKITLELVTDNPDNLLEMAYARGYEHITNITWSLQYPALKKK